VTYVSRVYGKPARLIAFISTDAVLGVLTVKFCSYSPAEHWLCSQKGKTKHHIRNPFKREDPKLQTLPVSVS
jgi:hypothetical protein